jgi:hypothetical protein
MMVSSGRLGMEEVTAYSLCTDRAALLTQRRARPVGEKADEI